MANAAGHLRQDEISCAQNLLGMDSLTEGSNGRTALGDMSTIICSYDHTAGYSSNSLASYMHDLGWRSRLHDLVTGGWLGSPSSSNASPPSATVHEEQSLGGNYGEATPGDLSFQMSSGDGSYMCSEVDKDPWPEVYVNSLTALSSAEMTRRLALHDTVSVLTHFYSTLHFPKHVMSYT